jgi:glycosyltransferase 2 family protein
VRRLIELAKGPLARTAGLLLSIATLGLFALLVAKTVSAEDAFALLSRHWVLVVATVCIYLLAYLPMTAAWILLARSSGAAARSPILVRILLVSQIAKYLPGNVGQFLGRAWIGQQAGVPLRVSGRAMALELAGVLAACAILAIVALSSGLVGSGEGGPASILSSFVVALAAFGALAGAAIALGKGEDRAGLAKPLATATALYIALLMLLACSNIMLVFGLSGTVDRNIAGQVAGAFAVSWLAGFVTPGSPAGLGVREVTFYTLLAGAVPQDVLLMTALAFRIATMTGDSIMWLAGIVMPAGAEARFANSRAV